MKRKTETNKWKDSWYVGLSPLAKLLLAYLYDNCDEAGFIDPIFKTWEAEIGINKSQILKSLLELKPALVSNKKKLFIKDFLLHQEKLPLNPENKEDRWILTKLESNLEKFSKHESISGILLNKVEKKSPEINYGKGDIKFVKPKIEEFIDYYKTINPDANKDKIEELYDYYVSCGWKVGKKPMKDWQAAIRNALKKTKKTNFNNSDTNNKSKIDNIREANDTLTIDYDLLGKKQ